MADAVMRGRKVWWAQGWIREEFGERHGNRRRRRQSPKCDFYNVYNGEVGRSCKAHCFTDEENGSKLWISFFRAVLSAFVGSF